MLSGDGSQRDGFALLGTTTSDVRRPLAETIDAHERLAAELGTLGWDPILVSDSTRIQVEQLGDSGSSVTRVWSTPLAVRWRSRQEARGWRAILMVDGAGEFRSAGRRLALNEGEVLLTRDPGLELHSATTTAMMTATGSWTPVIEAAFGLVRDATTALRPSPAAAALFAALINQGIAGGVAVTDPGFTGYWRTVEHSVSFLAQSGGSWVPEGLSPVNAELFRRSLRFMERNYHRADLSISEISGGAFTSVSTLFRAFRAANTSPHAVLRHLRTTAARHDIAQSGDLADFAAISQENGFRSSRSMRAALAS